ncbi:MAG: hypothetical protein HY520_00555 [Candidatus Aenigmarchaeota archaeon]|nr:hypothetical protein [Candidatus Aenigmarchaeota archaeon]
MAKYRQSSVVISEFRLNFDVAQEILYREGMDPERLTDEDVTRLCKLCASPGRSRKKPVTADDVRGKSVIVFRNELEKVDIHWLHGAEQPLTERRYFMDDLDRTLRENLSPDLIRPLEPHPSTGSGGGGGGGEPGGSRRSRFAAVLTEALFHYLVEHWEELRPYSYVEETEEIDVSDQAALKKRLLEEGLAEAFRKAGYEIKSVMSPRDLLAKAVQRLRRRLTTEAGRYLSSPDSSPLTEFPIDRLANHNDARAAIIWLEKQDTGRELDLLIRALGIKFRGQFADEKVPDTWGLAANNYRFTAHHPWVRNHLPERAPADDFAVAIVRHYLDLPQGYHKGDSSRIFDGLYVMDRITDMREMMNVRMHYGGPANYIILNAEGIGSILGQAVGRIRARNVGPRTTQKDRAVYKAIRDGSLEIANPNVDHVRCALDRTLLPEEREAFESMRVYGEEHISESYRQRVLRLYLLARPRDAFSDV